MKKKVRELMTSGPAMLPDSANLSDAAALMADRDVGGIVVTKRGDKVIGILTDRDIVIRAIAARRDPWTTQISEIVSSDDLALASPDASVQEIGGVMRSRAIRHVPVVDNGHLVGIVTLGDLARDADRQSALADLNATRADRLFPN